MVNGLSPSNIPYQGFPANAVGATPYHHLTSEDKQSYTWPIIGAVVSFLSLLAVTSIKRGKP